MSKTTVRFALSFSFCAFGFAQIAAAQHGDSKAPAATPAASPKPAEPSKPAAEPPKPAGGAPAVAAPSADDMAKMMAQWQKLMTPGEGHKRLEPMIGKWDAVQKIYMAGPQGPATETKGECENEWVLGGRYVLSKFKGTMSMGGPPMPFEGMGMTGYDNFRNIYTGTWCDNMGTATFVMKGLADQTGKVFTYYAEMDEPSLNLIGRTVKAVTRVVDNDKHVFEMYDLAAGDNYKVMEITYTRKK